MLNKKTAMMMFFFGLTMSVHAQGPTANKILERMDQNGDGEISLNEWLGPPMGFPMLDTNEDNVLTMSELEARFGGSESETDSQTTSNIYNIKWIDVHTHPQPTRGLFADYSGAIDLANKAYESSSISKIILMPPPQNHSRTPYEDFQELANEYPDRFLMMGGGGSLNHMLHDTGDIESDISDNLKNEFKSRAEEILANGAIGFGEIAIHHVSHGGRHPYESIAGDHPLMLLLADIAAEHGVPIDIHFDPIIETLGAPEWMEVPPNPEKFYPNMASFEKLLQYNRNTKIVWAHAGSDFMGHWTTTLTQAMLEKHSNLYMSIRMGPGRIRENYTMTHDGIKEEWLAIFKKFPDRFVIGNDQFFSEAASGINSKWVKRARVNRITTEMFISNLPENLAHKIGYKNAEKIYNIAP